VAPVEFPLIADEWLRERGLRENVDITYTYPIQRSHGVKAVSWWVDPIFEERDINVGTSFNVEEIDPEEQVLHTMENKELDFDLAVTIPPHHPEPTTSSRTPAWETTEDGSTSTTPPSNAKRQTVSTESETTQTTARPKPEVRHTTRPE